jgi:predicted nucleic acid-binding protein
MKNKKFAASVVIDNNVLVKWITAEEDSSTFRRLSYFFDQVTESKQQIIVPAPVVAEFLVVADEARLELMKKLRESTAVTIAAFDYRAAVECSLITAAAKNRGDTKYGGDSSKQKIKIDEQIVSIARVMGATLIVSNDRDVQKIAARVNIETKQIEELDLPPTPTQGSLGL